MEPVLHKRGWEHTYDFVLRNFSPLIRVRPMNIHMYFFHDEVMKWKHFPRCWLKRINWWQVDSSQRPMTRNFDVFLDLRLHKRLSKHYRRRWFGTPSRLLWHHQIAMLHYRYIISFWLMHMTYSSGCSTGSELKRYTMKKYIKYFHYHICALSVPQWNSHHKKDQ